MKNNYQVTIGYKAVICVEVKAGSEQEAKTKAIDVMKIKRDQMFRSSSKFILNDDSFKADGVLNLDEIWNML